MFRRLTTRTALLALLAAVPLCAVDADAGLLTWRNGDRLEGRVLGGDAETLRWRSDTFAEPFTLRLDQLDSLRFDEREEADGRSAGNHGTGKERFAENSAANDPPGGDFLFLLRNGDHLRGDLVAIGDGVVTLRSALFRGTLRLRRDDLERIERIREGRIRLIGPLDREEWESTGVRRQSDEWETSIRGELLTRTWHADLFRAMDFPDRVEVAFTVIAPSDRPHFEAGLLRDAETGPRIETWNDKLVLTHGNRFALVRELGDSDREVSLRLFWDQESGELLACSPDGSVLARLDGVAVEPPENQEEKRRDPRLRGFSLVNHTSSLRLARLAVREWSGDSVPVVDPGEPRLETARGDILPGLDDLRLGEGQDTLRGGGRSLPVDSVSGIVFARPEALAERERLRRATHVAWNDGSSASGKLLRMDGGEAEFHPEWSETPVTVKMEKIRRIQFPRYDAPLDEPGDVLRVPGRSSASLKGTLELGGNGTPPSSLLAWRPPGAENASPLAEGVHGEALRHSFPSHLPVARQSRLHLVNGEILVGSLVSLDAEAVRFESPVTGPVRVPQEAVRALDLAGKNLVLRGFSDPGWRVQGEDGEKGRIRGDELTLQESGGAGHPQLLLGDRVRFTGRWKQSYGAMTLRLFASSGDPSTPSADFILAAQGNRILAGRLKKGGAFSFTGEQIPIADSEAEFEIVARPEQVEIRVNGKTALVTPVEEKQRSGNGLYFRSGGGLQGWSNQGNEITLSNFSVDRTPGYLPLRVIDPEAKTKALQLPRFHRENPPRHLLVAPGGDLLRGTLDGLNEDTARFLSRDESIELPRERIASVVWLRKPAESSASDGQEKAEGMPLPREEKESPQPPDPGALSPLPPEDARNGKSGSGDASSHGVTHQFLLRDGSRLLLAARSVDGDSFIGSSALLGECTITVPQIREMVTGPVTSTDSDGAMAREDWGTTGYEDWVLRPTPDPAIPGSESGPVSPLVGEPAPDFTLAKLDGSQFTMNEHRGKVVVLDFWATWCGPCVKAMPELTRALAAFSPREVAFAAVNQGETSAQVARFLEAREWVGNPVVLDFDMEVSQDYQVKAIPHTIVVGKDGRIAWVHTGADQDLRENLAKAIATELNR